MSRGERAALAALAAAAVAIRLGYLASLGGGLQLPVEALSGDPRDYHTIAANLAAGRGYTWPWPGSGPHAGQLVPTGIRAPLLPLVLAVLYRLAGPVPTYGRLLLIAADAVSVVVLVLLGRRLAGPKVGWVAGAMAALYPPLVTASASLMTEPLFTMLLLLLLLVAVGAAERPSTLRWVLLGLLVGSVALARPNGAGPAAAVALWVVWRRRGDPGLRRQVAASALVALLVVAPWTAWISAQMGRFVPITTTLGPVLAGEYSSRMTDLTRPDWGGWDAELVLSAYFAAPDEATAEQQLRTTALEWIRTHPADTALLVGLHVVRYLDTYWAMDDRAVTVTPTGSTPVNIAAVLSWWAAAGLGVVGWRRVRRGPAAWRWRPAVLVWWVMCASGVLLAAATRYRVPTDPIVLLLAAVAVVGSRSSAADDPAPYACAP